MKTGNYNKDIHEVDFRAPFEKKRITAETLINPERQYRMSLNGEWHYTVDWYESAIRASWPTIPHTDANGLPLPLDFDFLKTDTIKVPSCWNTEKRELTYFEGMLDYAKNFTLDEKMKKKDRFFLHAEGIAYRAYIFLNGAYLGCHDGGSTPFTLEITEHIKKEEENTLILCVENKRLKERIPAENFDWFDYGGIFRDIHILAEDKQFIEDFRVSYSDGKLLLDVYLKEKKDTKIAVDSDLIKGTFLSDKNLLHIEKECSPHLWSPEDPYLYTFTLKAGSSSLKEKIGLRTIRTQNGEILLNGKVIILKGACVHEHTLKSGRSVKTKDIIQMIRDTKEMGGNFLRLSHYPHSRDVAKLCDELGLLLWEELPVYWAIDFKNRRTYEDAENQLVELIKRDFNRASVILWGVGNENADTDERYSFMSRLADKAHSLDNTRLVSAACLVNAALLRIEDRLIESIDVIGINEYYLWYDRDITKLPRLFENSKPGKPVIITEFGAGAETGFIGEIGELFSEENQRWFYEKQFEVIKSIPYIKGTTPWLLYDTPTPRRMNIHQRGRNIKGLIGDDHKTRKRAYYEVKKQYEEDMEISSSDTQ